MFLAFIPETCSGLFISSDSRYNRYVTLQILISIPLILHLDVAKKRSFIQA